MPTVIYADPPWPEDKGGPKWRCDACKHFDQMTVQELSKLPVKGMVGPSAVLFMWTTWRHMDGPGGSCFDVIRAWGFRFVTVGFVWVKVSKAGLPVLGNGYYTRANSEPCLLAVRGSGHVPKDRGVNSVVTARRTRPLATKPEEVRNRIERMYPHYDKLELFGRSPVPGWEVLGDEVDGADILQSIEQRTRNAQERI